MNSNDTEKIRWNPFSSNHKRTFRRDKRFCKGKIVVDVLCRHGGLGLEKKTSCFIHHCVKTHTRYFLWNSSVVFTVVLASSFDCKHETSAFLAAHQVDDV